MQHFQLPALSSHPSGWGPPPLAQERQVPYAPFSKSDRLGKAADWTAPDTLPTAQPRTARFRTLPVDAYGSGTADMFAYTHAADDDASFSVVDRAAVAPKQRVYGRAAKTARVEKKPFVKGYKRPGMSGKFGYNDKPQRLRDASVQVEPEWVVVEEIEFTRLSKLNCEPSDPIDLEFHGSLNYFNKDYDKVTVKLEKPMRQFDRTFHYASTSEDPIMHKLSKDVEGPAIFITSPILSTLMCTTRSVYPWDVVITKEGDKIFIDKRPDSLFDFVTVNENASDPPIEATDKETINSPGMLAQEATYINRNFSLQVLKDDESISFENPNPFYDPAEDPSPPAPVLYRYRQFDLDDTTLIVRTQLDCAINLKQQIKYDRSSIQEAIIKSSHPFNDTMFGTIHALNEFDPKAPGAGGAPEWRQKLDTQRGAVMATEMKNNGNKLAKWGVEAMLAGAETMKIGFVSRAAYKDRQRHGIIACVGYNKPAEFVSKMGYNAKNGWGIVKGVLDLVRGYEDGKFMLIRDPNKPIIRLYQLPADAEEFAEYEEK